MLTRRAPALRCAAYHQSLWERVSMMTRWRCGWILLGFTCLVPSLAQSASNATPNWTKPLGNSINWLSVSKNGNIILTGTFLFKQSGSFNISCFSKYGTLKWQDPINNVYEGVNWTGGSAGGKDGAAGGGGRNTTPTP